MRVLLDTDVTLDFLLKRQPFADDALAIWLACARGQCTGYVSSITPVNVYYIARKIAGADQARQYVADLLTIARVSVVDDAVLRQAQAAPVADFEDAVQIAAAVASGLDAIVTRNGGDFKKAQMPVYSPDELGRILDLQPG